MAIASSSVTPRPSSRALEIAMSARALADAQEMARKVVDDLGGTGIFGVEFFVVGDEVIFSKYGGTEIKVGADEVLILRESDVLAKVVGDRAMANA